jgi:hypothetical protein
MERWSLTEPSKKGKAGRTSKKKERDSRGGGGRLQSHQKKQNDFKCHSKVKIYSNTGRGSKIMT